MSIESTKIRQVLLTLAAKRLAIAVSFVCGLIISAKAASEPFEEGVSAYKNGQYAQAARSFEQCKANRVASADVYYYSGLTYERLGKLDAAIKDYAIVIKQFPDSEAAKLAAEALSRPSVSSMLLAGQAGSLRSANLDYYPKETWVPFQRVRNSILVEGSINGQATPMIFDTGASSCTFTVDQLKTLGVALPQGGPSSYAGGVGSSRHIPAWTMLADIKLGKIERRRFPISVIESSIPMPLLGENFYHDLEYSIDGNSSTISFKTRTASAAGSPAPVQAGMTVSAGGKYVYNVPFRMEGKSLIVNVKVDGRPCEMIFDTGADLSMFTQRQIRELNLHPENTGQSVHMGGISGRMVAPLLRFADVQLGPISQPMLCTVSDLAALPRPLLGQNFYKDYPFTIDHSSGVIRFEKK